MTRSSHDAQANALFATSHQRPASRDDFSIAIICALPIEADAMLACFDESWEDSGGDYGKHPGDPNAYTTGRIGRHNIVLAHMPGMGNLSAAMVAANLRVSFRNTRLALVVGICGGMPDPIEHEQAIFLGDVIVSTGIVQYDFGRQYADGFIRKDTVEDTLGRAGPEIRAFLQRLQGRRSLAKLHKALSKNVNAVCSSEGSTFWNRPPLMDDMLFPPEYRHKHYKPHVCSVCAECVTQDDPVCSAALSLSCMTLGCDGMNAIPLERRRGFSDRFETEDSLTQGEAPEIHFGRIASGNSVIKSSRHRDQMAMRDHVLGFEMESAGVWDNFPTIVIKGVCDYADSHKNKRWQKYASVTAAACAKALLNQWRGIDKDESQGTSSSSTGQVTATFHNMGGVGMQATSQTFNAPIHYGPLYHYSTMSPSGDNYGSQTGFNFGTINNNDYRR